MAFHTPHGSVRYRLPWSWAAFDYRELCRLLFAQCDARFEIAKVDGRAADGGVSTDRGVLHAPLVVDALGWRRVLGAPRLPAARRPALARARGPPRRRRSRPRRLDRSLAGARRLRWSVPAAGEQRVGAGSYEPRDHVKRANRGAGAAAGACRPSATRATGSPTACAAPPRTTSSSSATRPATASRSRARASAPRSTSASPAGASCDAVLAGERTREQALSRYAAFSAGHARAFGLALRLQWLIPRAAAAPADAGAARARAPAADRQDVRLVPGPGRTRAFAAAGPGQAAAEPAGADARCAGAVRWPRAIRCRSGACPRSAGAAPGPSPSASTPRAAAPRGRCGARRCPAPRARAGAARGCGADAGERTLQLAEAAAPLGEVADHENRPLATDDVRGGTDGTGVVYRPR